jgi:iron complex outermembrane receptor protein
VYEVGYRASPNPRLTFSVAGFYEELSDLRGGRFDPVARAFLISNEIEGTSRGFEAWALFQATDRWRLMAGWLELDQDLHPRPGSTDVGGPAALGNDPRHSVKLRSYWRVSDAVDLDVSWRYVSALAFLPTVPAYSATDARVAWRVTPAIELSLQGSDLFHGSHVEFDEHGLPASIPRAWYAQLRVEF